MKLTAFSAIAIMKQWMGFGSGSTPKTMSPTRPREAECLAALETGRPRANKSVNGVSMLLGVDYGRVLTFHEHAIRCTVQCPDIAWTEAFVSRSHLDGRYRGMSHLPNRRDSVHVGMGIAWIESVASVRIRRHRGMERRRRRRRIRQSFLAERSDAVETGLDRSYVSVVRAPNTSYMGMDVPGPLKQYARSR